MYSSRNNTSHNYFYTTTGPGVYQPAPRNRSKPRKVKKDPEIDEGEKTGSDPESAAVETKKKKPKRRRRPRKPKRTSEEQEAQKSEVAVGETSP